MDHHLSPIAVFVYNRPELTLRTLQDLSRNAEAADSLLYIFADGPRAGADEAQLARLSQVREVIGRQQWCGEVRIIQSEKNKGLANSIIAGVTQVVAAHGSVIVLEDDLSLSPYFLSYMNQALQIYEKEEKVLAVHGYLYPLTLPDSVRETSFFIRDPGSLGWGTWKRAWDLFEPDTKKLFDLIRLKGLKGPFTYWGGYPFMRTLRQQMEGKVDSWAIRWRAVAYLHDRLVLYPAVSLVNHEGNVPEATHHYSEASDWTLTQVSGDPVRLEKIPLENNEAVEHTFGRFLKENSGMSWKSKIKNKLGKWLSIRKGARD